MILEHYSKELLNFDRSRVYDQRPESWHKPRGFWVSVKGEDDWPSWAESENFYWPENFKHRYEVTVREGANVLRLSTISQIRDFHERFNGPLAGAVDPVYSDLLKGYVDWRKVVAEYDGIIIAPYQWPIRMDSVIRWYYSWDVASGCFWNLDVIDIEWKEQDWAQRKGKTHEHA